MDFLVLRSIVQLLTRLTFKLRDAYALGTLLRSKMVLVYHVHQAKYIIIIQNIVKVAHRDRKVVLMG